MAKKLSLNLYDIMKEVLNESVDQQRVNDAIDSRRRVFIDYSDADNNAPGQRLIEPYALGITKAGNLALRAYQYQGATLRGIPKWKMFRLDRITKWKPLNSHFSLEPRDQGWDAPAYNEKGDNTMVSVINQVKFDKSDNGLYQPSLDRLKKQTDQIKNNSNAITMSKLETIPSGPIRQRKNNVFTSQPNSKKYKQYQQNIAATKRDAEETNNYWGNYDKAAQERNLQNMQDQASQDIKNYSGPIKNNNIDNDDDEWEEYLNQKHNQF